VDAAARVLQECAANPDDDAPRLVWADLGGGERGELVVIQCDLARGNLTPNEAAKRRARERELLDKHGIAWAGPVATIAARWAFRRGFIESVKLRSLSFDHAFLPPLVANVTITDTSTLSREQILEVARRVKLRGLGLVSPRFDTTELGAAPELAGLRAVEVEWPTLETLLPLLRNKPVIQLRVRNHRFVRFDVERIVEAAPQLASLDLWPETGGNDDGFLGVFMQRPLRALRTSALGWKHIMYMAEHSAKTLEHLAFPLAHEGPRTIGELAKYTALRTLELTGEPYQLHGAVEALARMKDGFASLRVLKISEQLFPDEVTTLRARFPNQLEVLESPIVNEKRLLHDHFASSFALTPTCYVKAPHVYLAQPGAKVWEFPPRPADEPIRIGRDGGNDVVLFSSFVARRHAGLLWENGAHTLRDYGSDNGTWIDGAMIPNGARIADGTRFLVGNVPLVYCIGDGAKDRAQRIVQSVGGT
jgi:hypothetical protein